MPATRMIWGGIVIVLLAVFLFQWDQLEPKVEDTSLVIASREILSSANEFKNYWVVNGQPSSMNKEGVEIIFTSLGWPIVINDQEIDCQKWIAILLPDKETIYTDSIRSHKNLTEIESYHCDYSISNGKVMSVMLNNGIFKVRVGS